MRKMFVKERESKYIKSSRNSKIQIVQAEESRVALNRDQEDRREMVNKDIRRRWRSLLMGETEKKIVRGGSDGLQLLALVALPKGLGLIRGTQVVTHNRLLTPVLGI